MQHFDNLSHGEDSFRHRFIGFSEKLSEWDSGTWDNRGQTVTSDCGSTEIVRKIQTFVPQPAS